MIKSQQKTNKYSTSLLRCFFLKKKLNVLIFNFLLKKMICKRKVEYIYGKY